MCGTNPALTLPKYSELAALVATHDENIERIAAHRVTANGLAF
jgi:hypothetical protein